MASRPARSNPPPPPETKHVVTEEQMEARRDVLAWLLDGKPEPTDDELEEIRREWKG